jgi:hypothetical protein
MIPNTPTSNELAQEALQALRTAPPESSREHFARLVRMGLIDTQGRVTKLFGGDAEPEIDQADALLANKANGIQ